MLRRGSRAIFLALLGAGAIFLAGAMPQGPPPDPAGGAVANSTASSAEDSGEELSFSEENMDSNEANDTSRHPAANGTAGPGHHGHHDDKPPTGGNKPNNSTDDKPTPNGNQAGKGGGGGGGGFNNAKGGVNKDSADKAIEAARGRMPNNIDWAKLASLPDSHKRDADKLVKRFGGNIQLPNFQTVLSNVPQQLLSAVTQGSLANFSRDDWTQIAKVLPDLQSKMLCDVNDTQKQNAIEASLGDCSKMLSAAQSKLQLPAIGTMIGGMSKACGYTMSNETFIKVAKCANQQGSGDSRSLQQFLQGLFSALPKDPAAMTKDMLNAAGVDNVLNTLSANNICKMNQTAETMLSTVRSNIEKLKAAGNNNASDVKRLETIATCLTRQVRGPLSQWNASTLAQELPNLKEIEALRQLNGSVIEANLGQIKTLSETKKLSLDQLAALANAYGKFLNAANMTQDQIRDLLNNKLSPSFLCELPDKSYDDLKAAAANKSLIKDFRSKLSNVEACKSRMKAELAEACKNKTNATAFDGLLQTNDDATRNKTCAVSGAYADFKAATDAILNSTNVADKVTFWKSVEEKTRQKALAEDIIESVRGKDKKLDVSLVSDELLKYVKTSDIAASTTATFCNKADVWMNVTNEMDDAQRAAVRNQLMACGKTAGDFLTSSAASAATKATVTAAAAKDAVKSGKVSPAALRDAVKALPSTSTLARVLHEVTFGRDGQVTSANISADPTVVSRMECSNIKSIGDSQILTFITDVCATGQPMKPKTAGCLKDKLCQYVERILSTTVGAATDDVKCLAGLSTSHIDGLCFQVLIQFSDAALASLQDNKGVAAIRRAALATPELLIRYSYSKINTFATAGVKALGASTGELSDATAGDLNCMATYLNPSDISRMTPAAMTRCLDCFGKAPYFTVAGTPFMPLISAAAAQAVAANIRNSDGSEASWGSIVYQKLGCVAEFGDISQMAGLGYLNCTMPPVPGYLRDEWADINTMKAASLDPALTFNWTLAAQTVRAKKASLFQQRVAAEFAAMTTTTTAAPSTTTSTTTTTTATSTTRAASTASSAPTSATTTMPSSSTTTAKSGSLVEAVPGSDVGKETSGKLVAAPQQHPVADDYEYEVEEPALNDAPGDDGGVKTRRKRQAVTAPTCNQIAADGIGANGLTVAQVEAMQPVDVYNCLGPLGSEFIGLITVATAIFNKIKMYYAPAGQPPYARYVPPEAYWKLNYAALGITVDDIGDMTLNMRTSDNRTVISEMSALPPNAIGFASDQVLKFASEMRLDTGTYAWIGSGDVQAMGLFLCGMTTSDISSMPSDALVGSLAMLRQLPCGQTQMSALMTQVKRSNAYMDVTQWSASTVRELGNLVAGLSNTEFAKIPSNAIAGLTATAASALPTTTVKAMTVDQLKSMESTAAKAFTKEQMASLTTTQRDAWITSANFLRSGAPSDVIPGRGLVMAAVQVLASLLIPALAMTLQTARV